MNSHVRVLCLLVSLLLDCCGLAVVCGLLGASHGMHTLSFMGAEVRSHYFTKMKAPFLLCVDMYNQSFLDPSILEKKRKEKKRNAVLLVLS